MAVVENKKGKNTDLDAPIDGTMLDYARMIKHSANSLDKEKYPYEVKILSEAAEEIKELMIKAGFVN